MEITATNIGVYVLAPILTAVLGGCFGAYFGNIYSENKESVEKDNIRNIAILFLFE